MEIILTIVVCARNEELFLERCIRSLLAQETPIVYEIIVVNDASEDSTREVVENHLEPSIRLINLESKMGIGFASNIGVRASRGRFVVRVDADDYVSRHFVHFLVFGILETQAKALRCDYLTVNEDGEIIDSVDAKARPIACGIIYEKDSLAKVGLYKDHLQLWEDKELEERFQALYKIQHLAVPLYRYRQHAGNTSGGQQ